jgi:Fe-S cluster biogenesis protein NfuA/nitrite reductase/ring-hydroxylating ferredoxin subunit
VDFDAAVRELDTLVETLERDGDERALLLLQLVDAVHRPGLERLSAGDVEHPLAQALLGMYDLAPVEDRIRVEEALDDVRPYIQSHGGEVELLAVEDGVVRLRLSGACHGCAGSAMTLKRGIEEALRAGYPDFKEVVAVEPVEEGGPQLLQIEDLRRPVFAGVGNLPAEGELRVVPIDDVQVLLLNVQGEPYAFRNACAVDGMPLEGARLADTVLVCPWHNCAYDARTGKRMDDDSQPGLAVIPVALDDGAVQVAVNVL